MTFEARVWPDGFGILAEHLSIHSLAGILSESYITPHNQHGEEYDEPCWVPSNNVIIHHKFIICQWSKFLHKDLLLVNSLKDGSGKFKLRGMSGTISCFDCLHRIHQLLSCGDLLGSSIIFLVDDGAQYFVRNYFISFRFVSFRFVSFRFVSFRFVLITLYYRFILFLYYFYILTYSNSALEYLLF